MAPRSRWYDVWMDPTTEIIVACILLVLSGWFWFDSRGAIWDGWKNMLATAAAVLGPWFAYRAWTRRSEEVEVLTRELQ